MSSSTVPAVKGALRDALAARAGLAGVQIAWGVPSEPGPELVLIGDISGQQVAVPLGARRRQEDYTLTVHVDVLRRDGDQEGGTRRVFAIAAEIENELRTNATLGVAGVISVQVAGPFGLEEVAFESQGVRESILEISLAVKTRI